MPALADRFISWTRAKRRAPQRRATTYNFADDSSAIAYNDVTDDAECWRTGVGKDSCRSKWWRRSDVGEPYHMTAGPSSSLQFTFKGSSVSLMGRTMASPAQAIISIDGGAESTVSFAALKSGSDSTQPLWTSLTLDESKAHILRLRYEPVLGQTPDKSNMIGIRSFIVESTQSQANIDAPSSNHDQTVSIAAGLSGAIALLLVLIAFVFYWRRRGLGSHRRRPYHQRIASHNDNSSDGSFRGPGMKERMRALEATPWIPSNSGHQRTASTGSDSYSDQSHSRIHSRSSTPEHSREHSRRHQHSASSSALLSAPHATASSSSPAPSTLGHHIHPYRGHHHSSSSTELLSVPQLISAASSARQQQRSHYAYDAEHEPAAVPSVSSLALDILPPPPAMPASSSSRPRRGNASPTETTTSYESWTSSDFGPIPSPFVANGPPLPAVPAHLRSQVARPSPLGDEKRRMDAVAEPKRAALTRGLSTGRQSTLPPRYSAILD